MPLTLFRPSKPPERSMEINTSGPHSKAVLSIRTNVSVTLARQKVPLRRIVDLVQGSLLTFDTHCDEPLTLEAGGQPIAIGETIKIGDKFGIRIREILRKEED